ncbi:MAG TPA: Crp/Fnr family transcriptional regulator [Stellaceae bacterium]|nr:Crp/Fnr family transcriptional regulator [Stellaceae bacterium]
MRTISSAQPWVSAEFTRRFAKRLALTPDELPILTEILSTARPFRRRQDIVTEGRRNRTIFLLLDGLLIRYRITRDGHRQVVNLVVPGDSVGSPSCFFDGALYSVRCLTNSIVAGMSLETLTALLDTQPRLAAKLFWLLSCDAAVCAEHVVVVGRRSARQRIAHFFLELLVRLKAVGLAEENGFQMPFSQDVICDALGLSLAYVNRELGLLTKDGLVTIAERKLVIHDVNALADLADFEHRYLQPSSASELFAPPRPWEATWSAEQLAAHRRSAAARL